MKARPRTILLAEDNNDDAFLTTRAMEAAGITHTIHHCVDGQAVINYLSEIISDRQKFDETSLPDLVLLDLKMPRMDGLETLKWIRQHEKLKPLVVLALTSSSEQRDVSAAYQLHINAYLVKPSALTQMIELAGAIRHFWLDQSHLIKPRISFSTSSDVSRC
jgi:two-component system, response regulator